MDKNFFSKQRTCRHSKMPSIAVAVWKTLLLVVLISRGYTEFTLQTARKSGMVLPFKAQPKKLIFVPSRTFWRQERRVLYNRSRHREICLTVWKVPDMCSLFVPNKLRYIGIVNRSIEHCVSVKEHFPKLLQLLQKRRHVSILDAD